MPGQSRRNDERNEFLPRERGLLVGDLWAHVAARDHLLPIADGDISPDLRREIERYLVYSDDIENPSIFWEGFRDGVRAFVAILDQEITRRGEA